MKGLAGSGGRYESYFFEFFDYVYERNQRSAFPATREIAYNIAQEFWAEIDVRIKKHGPEEFYKLMKPTQFNAEKD